MTLDKRESLPFVTIVICTFNRKKFLEKCLESIFAIKYPKSLYEVIVVDGGSTDGTKELCKKFPNIRFVVEERYGLAAARNKGAELSRGSIVAYTDDDCIVDKQWLRNLVAGFQLFGHVIGVGGPVFPLHPEVIPPKIYVKAALGLFDEGEKIKFVRGIITSNSAFKREIFSKVMFDEKLGTTRRGKLILSGEDVDFCQNLITLGYNLLYTPYAKVYHQVPIDRLRVTYIVKRALHSGISTAKSFSKVRDSRIHMIRLAVGSLIQRTFTTILDRSFLDRSFTSCYKLLESISALVVCLTYLDKILLRYNKQ
jgi:glycosyltransferase involved in cell wall biosynthesis